MSQSYPQSVPTAADLRMILPVFLQDPVAIRLRHGALYGLPMVLVAAGWAACYASSAAGLVAAMHGASLSTQASLQCMGAEYG